jgi:beta-phosphoglucomutase-like phosphatase (HAD superfamily)
MGADRGHLIAVLFDIDGTLINTGGASDRAWKRAFLELHGLEVEVGDYTGKGVTDPVVGMTSFRGALGQEPSAAEMAKLMSLRLRYLPEEVAGSPGFEVLPGVEELLERLIDDGVLLGLITGNVEAAAHIKLARANLNRFFAFGGYGSDADQRVEVARTALSRAATVSGHEIEHGSCLAVGDTPVDIEAAHGAGIRILSVATGEYSLDQLAAAGADLAVATLRDWPGIS